MRRSADIAVALRARIRGGAIMTIARLRIESVVLRRQAAALWAASGPARAEVAARAEPIVRRLRRLPIDRMLPPRARRASDALRRAWRRSLQLRMVTITLMLSTLLVGAFGFLVASTISQGLLDAKVASARKQVEKGEEYALSQLKVVTQHDDPALLTTVPAVVAQLGQIPEQGGVEVVMLSNDGSVKLTPQASAPLDPSAYEVVRGSQLRELRAKVGAGKMAWQLTTANPDRHGDRPFLAFGTRVDSYGGNLELYYLFPLDAEVNASNMVATTVIVTGVALIALLAMVSGLVTRLVVRPVRLAARTAQRLSAGLLDQRMEVHGEDDLARLAASFNQMAANLQRQIVRLEEMSRLQRRFTSDVSHELRTPLTTVRMAADLIFGSREEFDPAVARSAELLQTELDRFEGLLTDLLEISRFDAGFAVLDAEPTDLVPIVHRVVAGLASLAERAGCEVQVDVPAAPVIAEIDPRRVERILRNLVGNAVEHGEAQPVQVRLGADDAAVAVTVRDHGVGLGTGEEDLVFNRFWRADPSRARQTGGTGLGLSISLEDARLHGGRLEAWGAPGQGAQFRLTLPVRVGNGPVGSPLRLVPTEARPAPVVLVKEPTGEMASADLGES